MRLAVIPARGGSKRIPRKNARDFCGKPMIARSIKAALQSGVFDRVIVSTDDAEIATIATEYGAEVPFIRPVSLSDDMTPTRPVIAHAIEEIGAQSGQVCCIYATAPFIQADDIKRAQERLDDGGASYVFPITSFAYPIERALLHDEASGHVKMFNPDNFAVRSQDLQEAWHDAGQFYWATASQWLRDEPVFNPTAVGIPIPRYRVQDIDTSEDWIQAELLFKAMGGTT